jgi:hypothetical protein
MGWGSRGSHKCEGLTLLLFLLKGVNTMETKIRDTVLVLAVLGIIVLSGFLVYCVPI